MLVLLLVLEDIFCVVYFGSLENWDFGFVPLVFCMIGIDYLFDISVPMMHISFRIPIFIMFKIEIPPSKMFHINISNPENSRRFLKYLNLTDPLMRFNITCRPSLKAFAYGQLFWNGFRFVI